MISIKNLTQQLVKSKVVIDDNDLEETRENIKDARKIVQATSHIIIKEKTIDDSLSDATMDIIDNTLNKDTVYQHRMIYLIENIDNMTESEIVIYSNDLNQRLDKHSLLFSESEKRLVCSTAKNRLMNSEQYLLDVSIIVKDILLKKKVNEKLFPDNKNSADKKSLSGIKLMKRSMNEIDVNKIVKNDISASSMYYASAVSHFEKLKTVVNNGYPLRSIEETVNSIFNMDIVSTDEKLLWNQLSQGKSFKSNINVREEMVKYNNLLTERVNIMSENEKSDSNIEILISCMIDIIIIKRLNEIKNKKKRKNRR